VFWDGRIDCWSKRHQAGVRGEKYSLAESFAAGRSQWPFCRYQRRPWAVRALDRNSLHECGGTGLKQPAWIRAAWGGPTHQAGDWESATELHGKIPAILRAIEFSRFFSSLDCGFRPHLLSLRHL